MIISDEHNEHPAYSNGEVVQWLMIVAVVLSGVAAPRSGSVSNGNRCGSDELTGCL